MPEDPLIVSIKTKATDAPPQRRPPMRRSQLTRNALTRSPPPVTMGPNETLLVVEPRTSPKPTRMTS